MFFNRFPSGGSQQDLYDDEELGEFREEGSAQTNNTQHFL